MRRATEAGCGCLILLYIVVAACTWTSALDDMDSRWGWPRDNGEWLSARMGATFCAALWPMWWLVKWGEAPA